MARKMRSIPDGFECRRCGYKFTGPTPLVNLFRDWHEEEACEEAGG